VRHTPLLALLLLEELLGLQILADLALVLACLAPQCLLSALGILLAHLVRLGVLCVLDALPRTLLGELSAQFFELGLLLFLCEGLQLGVSVATDQSGVGVVRCRRGKAAGGRR